MQQSQFTDADTIRILVATDNHVGYEERDPIRGDDSWKSFDEIMILARTEDVDMVLLGGDLFHDNKPSRKAMYKVMRSLRKNCLGNKPCQLQFLSDATDVFNGGLGHVNYEDPDINISIPVFSIHGNHDDPSGEGNLCALDLLEVAGLVNYFGRTPVADDINAKPVLLQKGQTKLALYGISNVRDERMFRNFRDHNVTWFRPNQQSSDWFNLLAVHQNHHAHTATGYLPENMLPEWLDLVVWGHEHECLIDPSHNPETGFHVMQPGSSVATSLVPGEAVAKHVAIVSVTGRDFKMEKRRLKSVRPFVTAEIVLANDKRFKDLDKKKENRHELTKKLMDVVEEMIEEANAEWESIQEEDTLDKRPLPLIRLKVEYTAPEGGQYDIENPQRFSNRFQGKVANTNDVVHFYRKKTVQRKAPTDGELPEKLLATLDEIEDIKVDKLVAEFLSAQAQSLKILPQAPFGDAVNQFVDKDDKHAMESFVSESLSEQVKQMLSLGDNQDLESAMEQVKARLEQKFNAGNLKQARRRIYKPKPDLWDSDIDGHWEDQPEALDQEAMAANVAASTAKSQPTQQPKSRARKPTRVVEEEDEDMDDVFEEPAPKPKGRGRAAAPAKPKAAAAKAPARKAPARGRGKKQVFEQSDEEEEEEDVVMDDDDYDPPPPPPKRAAATRATRAAPARSQTSRAASSTTAASRASASASTKTKQSKLNFGSQKATQDDPLEISDDEISDDFEAVPAARTRKR
ncbi:DNA repair exonuclease [Annulohypoxylon bovei var. microspora]|nr:DNA repair exonuclease [Annulohypoxylon bovei var. microspora]